MGRGARGRGTRRGLGRGTEDNRPGNDPDPDADTRSTSSRGRGRGPLELSMGVVMKKTNKEEPK